MQIKTFDEMYIAELQELVSLETQLADALLLMAHAASHPSLKTALAEHQEESELQMERLLAILQKHRADPRAHTDQAMEALLDETTKMLTLLEGDDLRDAGLIASAQKIE